MRLKTLESSLRHSLRYQSTPGAWTTCCQRAAPRRRYATATETKEVKPYYITTPIFYVNAGTNNPLTSTAKNKIAH